MGRLFKAFFYKVSKDTAFRVALIIGSAFALVMVLLFLGVDLLINNISEEVVDFKTLSGQTMLVMSMLPAQDFGLVIPIIVICFIGLEFSQGTVRNKIIAGYSKFQVYSSLYLSGLLLYFMLIIPHIVICVGLGSAIGGFDPNGPAFGVGASLFGGTVSPIFILQYIILALLAYTSIVSCVVFFVTLFRSIGPCIPIAILLIIGCYFICTIANTALTTTEAAVVSARVAGDDELLAGAEKSFETVQGIVKAVKVIIPTASMTITSDVDGVATIDTFSFFAGVGSNLVYAAAFFFGGAAIFNKRDIK